jgi:hypothetical protein
LRHQLPVVPFSVTRENTLGAKSAAFFPVYLYWAISGVALADQVCIVMTKCFNTVKTVV